MFALVAVVLVFAAALAKKEDLVTLTNETFYEAVEKYGKVFVKFFAPWCGHCKRLAPAWEELAGTIEGVQVAEMDCTVEAHEPICSQYHVTGFPTLVLIEHGGSAVRYEDSREVEDMRAWAIDMSGPASKELEENQTVKGKDISFIFLGAEEADLEGWNNGMNAFKGTYGIYHTSKKEYGDVKVENKSILILKTREEPKTVPYDPETIRQVVRANNRLLVNELGPKNFSQFASDGDHAMWITFVKNTHDEVFDAEYQKLKEAAGKCGETVNFSYINAINFEAFTQNFAEMNEVPFSIILKPNDYLFYKLPEGEDICQFVKNVQDGQIEAVDIRERKKQQQEKEEKEENAKQDE